MVQSQIQIKLLALNNTIIIYVIKKFSNLMLLKMINSRKSVGKLKLIGVILILQHLCLLAHKELLKLALIDDIIKTGSEIILSNTYHLMIRPGVERINISGWSYTIYEL